MKKAVYSKEYREQALRKVYQRGSRSVRAIAEELSVNYFTLKNWMKETGKEGLGRVDSAERPPRAWTPEERLAALAESDGLEGEALAAWCRQRGVYAHHLSQWREEFCASSSRARGGDTALRQLKEENQRLRRELVRKEKALCEAGALLVLQKKFRALWEAEDA